MFKSLPLFPEQASTYASQVDHLYFFLIAISTFFGLLIAFLVVYYAVKYRRRSATDVATQEAGSLKLELAWTIIPFLINMVIFTWGIQVLFTVYRPPAGAVEVYVVGKQWMWKFQHPTGQREINELHVPVGQSIKLIMASEDVIHSFFVPAFRMKADVLPGRYQIAWFQATRTGTFHLFCAEYCGTKHAGMGGKIVVMEPAEFQTWLSGGPTEGSPVQQGQKLFSDLGCVTCHKPDGSGRGPVLQGLFGKTVALNNGQTVLADEAYVRESVLNPQAKITAGFEPVMPTFQGQISEDGLLQLIAYVKSLATPQPPTATVPGSTTTQPPGKKQ